MPGALKNDLSAEQPMQINHAFLTLNARNFDDLAQWWTMLLERRWDREPMPSCREWNLAGGVLFQILDNPDVPDKVAVTLHVDDLDHHVTRLRRAMVSIPEPAEVEGFATLRYTSFYDLEGNEVGLLEGN